MALAPPDDVAAGALAAMEREQERLRCAAAEMNGAIDAVNDLTVTAAQQAVAGSPTACW